MLNTMKFGQIQKENYVESEVDGKIIFEIFYEKMFDANPLIEGRKNIEKYLLHVCKPYKYIYWKHTKAGIFLK